MDLKDSLALMLKAQEQTNSLLTSLLARVEMLEATTTALIASHPDPQAAFAAWDEARKAPVARAFQYGPQGNQVVATAALVHWTELFGQAVEATGR